MEVRVYNPMGSRGAGKGANMVYHKGNLDHRMHNKIFLVDGAVAVLGGRNIGDDYFGVDEKLNFRDLEPANSYRVTLDEKGNLVWTAAGPDGPGTWHKEPGSTAWQRTKVRFMSWIPMEKEL